MIVGNCCTGCHRQIPTSKAPAPSRTAAVLSTSFRRPARRVKFEAANGPSLPQRIHASALGLARAAIATPESNALSSLASQGNAKFTSGFSEPSFWSQNARSSRPYWEQESCSSIYSDPSAAFRTAPPARAAQETFDSFSAEQRPLSQNGSEIVDNVWRDEFLRDTDSVTSDSTSTSERRDEEQLRSRGESIAQGSPWSNNLRRAVQRILPVAERLFDDLSQGSSAKPSALNNYDSESRPMDARTIKRLRMILQHLAHPAPSTAMLSVR